MIYSDVQLENKNTLIKKPSSFYFFGRYGAHAIKVVNTMKECLSVFKLYLQVQKQNQIQWKPLNLITDNVIIRLM